MFIMFVTLYDFCYSETKLDIFLQHCCICIIKKVNNNVQTITHNGSPQEKLADTKCMVSTNYQFREACYSFAGTKCAAPVISQK